MSEATRVPDRWRATFRAGLVALGGLQGGLGLYALIDPRSFYDDFPFGRGWVAALPEYSEHLVRDIGGLFLGVGILLVAAAWFLERRLVAVALVSYLAFSIPHTVYHVFNLEPYGTGDVVANLLTLAATVLVPLGLLALLRAGAPASPSAPAPAGSANGRVSPVPDSTRNPLVRYAFRRSRSYGGGEVMDPLRVFAHNPTVMLGYGAFELASERSHRMPERLKHLAELRAAMLCGCEWCLDYGSAISTAHGVSGEDLRALPTYGESARFDETERLVLDYATGMSRTPADVPDELFERMRARFDEAQLVELTSVIALENYRARFNWAFGLAGQGYSQGSVCVRPEPAAASGA